METKNLSERARKNVSGYVGDLMDRLGFDGMSSNAKRSFTFKIANNGATDITIALVSGPCATKAELEAVIGKSIDGLITDTIADFVPTCTPQSFELTRDFFNRNPATVGEIRMLVKDPAQFENAIEVFEGINPFSKVGSYSITPADDKDPDQNNDKLVHMKDINLQINDQTAAILKVNAGEEISLKFFIDVVKNPVIELDYAVSKRDSMRRIEL